MCYVAIPLYLCGFLVLGAGIQRLNMVAVVFGWGIAEVAVMINTVAICRCPILMGSTWSLNPLFRRCVLQRLFPKTSGGYSLLTTARRVNC